MTDLYDEELERIAKEINAELEAEETMRIPDRTAASCCDGSL